MKRKLLQFLLGLITKRIVKKYSPKIIAITGSVGKTSTKNAIAFFLKRHFLIRKSAGNLNTEIGLPLTFIGKEKGGESSFLSWLNIIFFGIKIGIIKDKSYPKVIIVEMGADKPGDISYLTGLVKPHIGVVTLISEMPVHLQNYDNLDQLVSEKSQIVRALNEKDYALLNFDDHKVRDMSGQTKAKVFYFGSGQEADVKISQVVYQYEENKPKGISFIVDYKKEKKVINLPFCFGKSSAYSIAAALSCGIALGLKLDKAAETFKNFKPEKGRMNLIEGEDNFYILDDSYNASPSSVKSAFEVLSSLSAERKIAILGDMKELGNISKKAHRKIGEIASKSVDILVVVGKESKQIRDRAVESGFNPEKVYHFESSENAIKTVKMIVKKGDLVLVKGSQAMRMEKIVERIMKEPQKAKELLVRQEAFWKNKNDY